MTTVLGLRIETAELVKKHVIRLRPLWPPYTSVCKVMMVLVTEATAREIGVTAKEIKEDQWYIDHGEACFILGEAFIGADEKYHPQKSYQTDVAISLTKRYRRGYMLKSPDRSAPPRTVSEHEELRRSAESYNN